MISPPGHEEKKKGTESSESSETPKPAKGALETGAAEKKSTQEKFLSELKEQFTQIHELRAGLDEKTDKMITLASAVATLLIGLGTFLVANVLEPKTLLFLVDIIILSIGVILSAFAIFSFIVAYRVRGIRFPFPPEKYVDSELQINFAEVDKVSKKETTEFDKDTIDAYLVSLRSAQIALKTKGGSIKWGQILFLFSLVSVMVVLIATLGGIALGSPLKGESTNSPPISNAGIDQIVPENGTVMLDASASRDTDGNITSYLWEQISGPSVNLSSYNDVKPTFETPNLNNSADLTFNLMVRDDEEQTATDTVNIQISNSSETVPLNCTIATGSENTPQTELFFVQQQNNAERQRQAMECTCMLPTGSENTPQTELFFVQQQNNAERQRQAMDNTCIIETEFFEEKDELEESLL
jgi:hypothetical protein